MNQTMLAEAIGHVVAVRGGVVDVAFPNGALPTIEYVLSVEWDKSDKLMLEVQAHLDRYTVRTVALHSTYGLQRGTLVRNQGSPIRVPVGSGVLGRLLDVTGSLCDHGPALPADTPYRSIHGQAPPLSARGKFSELFNTGLPPNWWTGKRFKKKRGVGYDNRSYPRPTWRKPRTGRRWITLMLR